MTVPSSLPENAEDRVAQAIWLAHRENNHLRMVEIYPLMARAAIEAMPVPLAREQQQELLNDINRAAHAAGTGAWVRDVLQRAHRAVRSDVRNAAWQPIETAPHNRELIGVDSDGRIFNLRWEPDDCGESWYDVHGDQIAYPIRWMLLPDLSFSSTDKSADARNAKPLSDYSDAEIRTELHHRAMQSLGFQYEGVTFPSTECRPDIAEMTRIIASNNDCDKECAKYPEGCGCAKAAAIALASQERK